MASAAVVIAAPAIPLSKDVDGVNVSIGEEGANVPGLKKYVIQVAFISKMIQFCLR